MLSIPVCVRPDMIPFFLLSIDLLLRLKTEQGELSLLAPPLYIGSIVIICDLKTIFLHITFKASHISLTYIYDMATELCRYPTAFNTPRQTLCPSLTPSGRGFMARVAIPTHRQELGRWVVGPYVRRLHPCISILAICDRVPWKALHPGHLPHTAAWVFDEPECWA